MCSASDCKVGSRCIIVSLLMAFYKESMFLWLSSVFTLFWRTAGLYKEMQQLLQPFITRGTLYCNITEVEELVIYCAENRLEILT